MPDFDGSNNPLRPDAARGNFDGQKDTIGAGTSVAVLAGIAAVLVIVALMVWTPWNDVSQVANRPAPGTVGSSTLPLPAPAQPPAR